ncbi:universal stress protein [Natronomonas gomsonensis]|jgi:nucleotide-binding universal stress UspA family protein|uniref:universal stress protein n=1 Tax=Natronomonas gomsonensis TaxID=1046043 RepID=UPI0020CA3DDC|nr:universal stress protein [Natronomonas gomsonensis]MCY4729883.1 universal stress protein [Natronomonas gomsonensis]
MYDQILFPTDGSDGENRALDHVLDIASSHGSTVHILNVADTTRDSLTRIQGEVVDVLEREGEDLLEEVAERAQERGVETVSTVVQGEPYRTIVEYADEYDIDLIVMPTHGRSGLQRLLLGSTTERVVRRAEVPVLTIRPDAAAEPHYPYRDVLVSTDGSEGATEALSVAADVATEAEAALYVLSAITYQSLGIDVRSDIQTAMLEESAEDIVEEATALAERAGVEEVHGAVEYGSSVHKAILSFLEEREVDLVVVGTHGRTGFDRYLLGSVAEALVRTSPVPVLTVRPPAAEDDE